MTSTTEFCSADQQALTQISIVDTLGSTNSIFEEPWWLDAVAPGAWGAATVFKGGQLHARLPFAIRSRYGFTLLGNPPLTQTLGPWFRPPTGKYAAQLAEEKELLAALIQQLPPSDVWSQTFDPGFVNSLPLLWHGCERTLGCTYRLEDLKDTDRIWAELTSERRNIVRRCAGKLVIRRDLDAAKACDLFQTTFTRKGQRSPFERSLFDRLLSAAHMHDAGQLFYAEDAQGRIHAAAFVVWDSRTAYYLLGGADPDFTSSGAVSLLIWDAIRFAATVTCAFDFEGSSNQQIEHFFRSFGARQRSLVRTRRMSRRFQALTAAKDLFCAASGRKVPWPC
jgi:hypothetical protein